jgi:hypothetical protein
MWRIQINYFNNVKIKYLYILSNTTEEESDIFYKLQELNEDILSELPIPNTDKDCYGEQYVEYVDDSFEINYFEE